MLVPVIQSNRLSARIWRGVVILGAALLLIADARGQCGLLQNARQANASASCSASGCRFGGAVAVSADGNTAIVGASGDNNNMGTATILVRSGGSWSQQGAKLVPTGGTGTFQYFGAAVAISTDGNTAVVGAYADANSVGAVYIFVRSGTAWTQQGAKLVPTGSSGVQFFGFSVSVSADGNTALIGAKGDNSYTGAAYIFTRSGTTWTQAARLLAADGTGFSTFFGTSVSLNGDGTTALIGAEGDSLYLGAAYIFVRSGATWGQQGSKLVAVGGVGTTLYFGASVSLSNGGNTALVGSHSDNASVGAAYVFSRTGTAWALQGRLTPNGGVGAGKFGWSVAISREATTAIIGAKSDSGSAGAAYVFTRTGTTWNQEIKLLSTGAASLGEFGSAVSVGSNGTIGFVGAPSESIGAGADYSFWRGCPADFNCSGTVNVTDIFSFLSAWFAMDARANFNGVGGITVADIFAFLAAWFSPC